MHSSLVVSSLWPVEGCPPDCSVGMGEEVACEAQSHLLMCNSSLVVRVVIDAFPGTLSQSEMRSATVLVSARTAHVFPKALVLLAPAAVDASHSGSLIL